MTSQLLKFMELFLIKNWIALRTLQKLWFFSVGSLYYEVKMLPYNLNAFEQTNSSFLWSSASLRETGALFRFYQMSREVQNQIIHLSSLHYCLSLIHCFSMWYFLNVFKPFFSLLIVFAWLIMWYLVWLNHLIIECSITTFKSPKQIKSI